MRKGIKILGKVLSAIVLLLIFLPLLLTLLLDIPAVQNFVVHKAADVISRKLETTVSIGRVDIGLFNKVKVYDFYVEDYQHDTLLYAGRVDALISGVGLFGGGITLGRAEIGNAKLCLHETASGELNIREVIDRMVNKDKPKKGNFKLTIASASVQGLEFCMERLEHKDPPFGVDFTHLHVFDIRGDVNDLTIDGSTIHTSISSLAARERSGFCLDDLSGLFYLTDGCLGFEKLSIVTARSKVKIPELSIVGDSWPDYKDFITKVNLHAVVRGATLSSGDVAFFAPALRNWNITLTGLNCEMEGTVDDFKATVSSLNTGDDTQLVTVASLRGLPDITRTHFDVELNRLATTPADIDVLSADVTGKRLPSKALSFIDNAGSIELKGHFAGTLASFRMQALLATLVGRADCNLNVRPQSAGRSRVQGRVAADNFRLGELLSVEKLGAASFSANVDGVVGTGYADAGVAGEVSKLEFNGYSYDSVRFDGRMLNKEFNGRITARDPNLDFDFAGMLDLNDSVPCYDFTLELFRADLARLHFNPRDSVSELSAYVVAKAAGRSLDDLNGRIRVSDVVYRYNDKQLTASEINIRGENSAHSKFVELRSDFADITFRSKTSYHEVFEYLKMSVWKYLPILYDRDKFVSRKVQETAAVDDYSLLSVQIKNINSLVDAFSSGLQIADGSQLQLLFNPAGDKISLRASSDYVERDRLLATKIRVNAANRGDSLAFYAGSEDFYMGGLHLRELALTGGAREGNLELNTGFSDTLQRVSGMLGFRAWMTPQTDDRPRMLNVRILPSHITRGSKTWQISSRRIEMDTARIVVDRFRVMNDQQELLIDGIASRNHKDSVNVRLRNFDLAPFSQFIERMGYEIEGVTNGTATVKSALRGGEITADIRLDSVRVNGYAAPPLQLVSMWDFQRNRAGVVVSNRIKQDTLIRGFYAPSQGRYYARAEIDSLDMGLLDPVLRGVISNTKGRANVRMVLTGQRRNAELRGQVRVKDLSTKVDFTQVTYSVPEVVVDVENNHFRVKNVTLFDPEGNRAGFDFDLSLAHLSNIAYNIRVTPQRMLVLNTTSQDNDLFYGKVYASGAATITGDKRGVNMDVAATSEDNSSFFMPLTGKSNISNADFVVFESSERADTTNYLARKKQLFEQRRRKSTTTAESMMNISLALNVRPDLEFQMDMGPAAGIIKGHGEGLLNLQINPRRNIFEMFGDYTITEGEYLFSLQNIISRKFLIDNGSSIQWTGSPMNALLNIDAVYKLKASLTPLLQGTTTSASSDRSVPVECYIHLGDRLTAPSFRFDVRVPSADSETQAAISNVLSSPETVQTQVFYLLVFSSFMSESNNIAANVGASASAATGLEFLSNQLSRLLSIDDYNVVIRYRPKSELTSDEVDFGLSKSLINNRLLVEVEGNYIVDNKQSVSRNMSNFMGEAYITWLIDRSGALKLRGFTQTIDRFDENQGLQETGIGIYYKEDFNNLKDLRQRVKARFTSKKRKARQEEARRQAEEAARNEKNDNTKTQ